MMIDWMVGGLSIVFLCEGVAKLNYDELYTDCLRRDPVLRERDSIIHTKMRERLTKYLVIGIQRFGLDHEGVFKSTNITKK